MRGLDTGGLLTSIASVGRLWRSNSSRETTPPVRADSNAARMMRTSARPSRPEGSGSRSARTQSELYEALAPLGLPDREPHRAEDGGWLNRLFHAIGIGRGLGI